VGTRDGTSQDRDADADKRPNSSRPRRPRRRRVRLFLAAVALCLAGWFGWYAYYTSTPEYRTAALISEYRALWRNDPPGKLRAFLIEVGLLKPREPRSAVKIGRDLRALGPKGIAAGVEAMLETPPAPRPLAPTPPAPLSMSWTWSISAYVTSLCQRHLIAGLGPDATGPLIAVLEDRTHRKPSERKLAVDGLGVLGPHSADAVLALVAAAEDEDKAVREAGTMQLRSLPSAPAAAVPRLVDLLERPLRPLSPLGRVSVLRVIARTGQAAKAAVPVILASLHDGDPSVRHTGLLVLMAIAQFDPARCVPPLAQILEEADPDYQSRVAHCLGGLGPAAAAAVGSLVRVLRAESRSTELRCEVVDALGSIGPSAEAAVDDLAGILRAGDSPLKLLCSAAGALGHIGPPAKSAVGALADVLRLAGKPLELRCQAAAALGGIGPAAGDAVPTLLETLRHEEWYLRAHSAVALGQIDPARPEVVAALVDAALSDSHARCRETAGEALAGAAASAGAAVAAFSKALGERDAMRRARAIEALSALARAGGEAGQAARSALTAALSDDDPQVRDQARRALLAAR